MKNNIEQYNTLKQRLQVLREEYENAKRIAKGIIDEKRLPYYSYIYTLYMDGRSLREMEQFVDCSYETIRKIVNEVKLIEKAKGGDFHD